jgi:hypothetical protein
MQPEQLDTIYTELAEAIGRVGEAKASLMLATLSLDLITRMPDARIVAEAIVRAERLAQL